MAVNYKVTESSVTKDLADIFIPIKNTVESTSIGPGKNFTIDMRNNADNSTTTITIPRLAIDSNGLVTSVTKQTLKVRHRYRCYSDLPCSSDDPGGNDNDSGEGGGDGD